MFKSPPYFRFYMSKKGLHFEDSAYLDSLRQKKAIVPHIHWDGSIQFERLWDYYQEKGQKLFFPEKHNDGTLVEGDREIKTIEQLYGLRDGLFSKFDIVDVFKISTMAMQTADDLKTMAVAHCQYLQTQNIVYAETRFAPWYHAEQGKRGSVLTLDEVIGHSLEGFAEGREKTGVIVKPIICINREIDPEAAKEIVKAALNFAECGVVGIDLACYEPSFPPEEFGEAFALTFNSHLKRTVHADEMVSPEEGRANLEIAINWLRADGISHGIHLYQNPDLVQLMIENKIRLESNPISNLTCGFIKRPGDLRLGQLVAAGVKVTINPDDPAMWKSGDLAHNLYLVGKAYGEGFIKKVRQNAIETAWGLSEKEKQELCGQI